MPLADGISRGPVTHQDRVHAHAQESLDRRRGFGARGHKIGKRSQDGTSAEPVARLEQPRGRRSEPNALALEAFQPVHAPLDRGVEILDPTQLGAR